MKKTETIGDILREYRKQQMATCPDLLVDLWAFAHRNSKKKDAVC